MGEHSNKYVNEIDNKRPGICMFYKAEIMKLLGDEANKTPYATMKILIKRRAEGVFFLSSNFFMSLI